MRRHHQRLDNEVEPQEVEDAFQLQEGAELNDEEMKISEEDQRNPKRRQGRKTSLLQIIEKKKFEDS